MGLHFETLSATGSHPSISTTLLILEIVLSRGCSLLETTTYLPNQVLVSFVLTTTNRKTMSVTVRLVYSMEVSHVLMHAFNDIQTQIDLLGLSGDIYMLSN